MCHVQKRITSTMNVLIWFSLVLALVKGVKVYIIQLPNVLVLE